MFALDDGKYTGVWKTTFANCESTAVKGDSGIFEFNIKDNKVIKIIRPDDSNWDKYKIKYFFKNNQETIELSGYCQGFAHIT